MNFTIPGINLTIHYYGIMLAFGILAAFFFVLWIFKKRGYNDNIVYHLLLIVVPLGIIGARVYYVIFQYGAGWRDLFDISNGLAGLAWYGGVFLAGAGAILYCVLRKINVWVIADIALLSLALAYGIGRWGNLFNNIGDFPTGEIMGIRVPHLVRPFSLVGASGNYYLSVWLLDSVLNLITFGVLLWFMLRKNPRHGTIAALYLIAYGVIRAVLEVIREDSLTIFGSSDFVLNRVSFVISIALVGVGVVFLILQKHGRLGQETKALEKREEEPPNESKRNKESVPDKSK